MKAILDVIDPISGFVSLVAMLLLEIYLLKDAGRRVSNLPLFCLLASCVGLILFWLIGPVGFGGGVVAAPVILIFFLSPAAVYAIFGLYDLSGKLDSRFD